MWDKIQLGWAWTTDSASSPEFWKALVAFATSIGIILTPAQSQAVIALGLAIMGALHAWDHAANK